MFDHEIPFTKSNISIFSGNAYAEDDTIKLWSDKISIFYDETNKSINEIFEDNGDIGIFRKLLIVENPENANTEIKLEDAINLNELNKDKDSCPSVNELLNKQNTAQQLCDALEYQENIRNNKVKLEKNRLYLAKVRDQKDQIKQLEEVVSELQVIKEARDSSEDMSKLAQYEYQKS